MHRSHRIAAALLLAVAGGAFGIGGQEGAPPSSAGTGALLQAGHHGGILAVEFDERSGLLFTSGDDGELSVWDAASGALVRRLGLGRMAPTAIAVNPVESLVAVLSTDGVRSYSVAVWDWQTGRLAFRRPLASQPLFLRWSGGGRWLFIGEPTWRSLIVLAHDGTEVAFQPDGFGIVGFAEGARSERTIMTYQPSGRIQYWEAATAALLQEVRTVAYLTELRVSADRRLAAGATDRQVVLVDLVTGAARATLDLPGLRSFDLAPSGDELACVATVAGISQFSRWRLEGDRFVLQSEAAAAPPAITIARYAADSLYAASGGDLWSLRQGSWGLVASDVFAELTGLAAASGAVAAASPEWIWIFRASAQSFGAPLVVANPLGGPTGLGFVGDRLIAWRRSAGSPAAVVVDPANGSVERSLTMLEGPLLQLEPTGGGRLVALSASGNLRLLEPADGRMLFETWLPGMLRAVPVSERELVGARTSIDAEGSLLRIDTATGETVDVATRARVTSELAFDATRRRLFSIGLGDGGTALYLHEGEGFERETLLSRAEDEDLGACLALDAGTGALYASLGSGAILSWAADGSPGALAAADRLPRRLAAEGGLLASANRDATVSLWDTVGSGLIADLSLLRSGEWFASLRDGRFAASEGAMALVRVIRDGRALADPEPWRYPVR